MMQLPSVAAYYEQMDRARRAGAQLTNFYPTPEKLQRWIDEGALFSATAGNVHFLLRRDRDFLHLSYMACRGDDLSAALHELQASTSQTLTVDLLGKREQVLEVAEQFVAAGFRPHRALHRMMRATDGTTATTDPVDPEVEFAGPDDAYELAGMLESALDRFAEQIPDADEMRKAAAERKVLIIRSATGIAGMLFFEVTGQSSLLRHWLVDSAYRDRRVGARLIRRYFADCTGVRRFTLWVISDNDNAIDRYRHYGYQNDVLVDHVLMRQAS
jgi:ribosomal protein S18 acetylase RimI-like enzyme